MMKKTACLVLFTAILGIGRLIAIPDPAALYAQRLGYEYKVVTSDKGTHGVVVVKPGVEFDAWEFYRGKVGSQYAYGDLYGYDTISVTENKGSFTVEYAVCVSRGENGVKQGERITLSDLMARNNEPIIQPEVWAKWPAENAETGKITEFGALHPKKALPASFDWRNVNGNSYIGPIQSQGGCGSCYAFAASAAAEGTYNYAMGLTGDSCEKFSESFIAWCLGRTAPYDEHFFGCQGADYEYMELEALCQIGIVKASVFPYQETDPGSCAYMDSPKVRFASWGRAGCNDIDAIKTAIMTYGVVDAAVVAGQDAFSSYSGGVYTDALTACDGTPCTHTTTDHAIALVGWNDADGCWILRNSWGANWGESGYMRISYQAARVGCAVSYLQYTSSPVSKLPVYRLYSTGAAESTYTHLWTISETEKNALSSWPSWRYEGIAWYAYASVVDGSTPLYRLYAPSIGRHLYTISAEEYTFLNGNGTWNGEGAQYYVMPSAVDGTVPAYRFYNAANRNHHFTIDENEKNTIIATPEWGYAYEGIRFYVYQSN